MNYPGAPPTQFSPGSSDPYPTRADPTDRRYTQAATQQPPDPSYQYPPGAGPTGTSYYTQADITAPTFPWAPFASGNMNYPYPAVAGPTHADPTHASYTHPHTAAPTVHTGSSSGARAGTTPPTYHSWMVMFPQGMYPMKSSRSREEGRQAIERLNCLHDSLQSLMKFANRSEYMTLADYSDFQDFNTAIRNVRGPAYTSPQDLRTFPSKYVQLIPKIRAWITLGETEWKRVHMGSEETAEDIAYWAESTRDELSVFENGAAGFEFSARDMPSRREEYAKRMTRSYSKWYHKVKDLPPSSELRPRSTDPRSQDTGQAQTRMSEGGSNPRHEAQTRRSEGGSNPRHSTHRSRHSTHRY